MPNTYENIFKETSSKMPKVNVYNKPSASKGNPGMASRIAIIGTFANPITAPTVFDKLDDAYETLGTDSLIANSCLPYLFYGASSVIAVHISEFTVANLVQALSTLMSEDFDMIFIATSLTEEMMPIFNAFLNKRYENKLPVGYVGYGNFNPEIAGDFCYGIITQAFYVNGTLIEPIISAAYYCGVLASLNVGTSMTKKVVPNVTAVDPEFTFETGDAGANLLESGVTVLQCQDRANSKYVVVNSEQPNGYDLYVNRVRDFVIREMNLQEFLGNRNRPASLNEIKQELDRVKDRCVNTLDLLKDIVYTVEKKNAKCVDVYIDKLLFDGIITQIDVYVTIEVE